MKDLESSHIKWEKLATSQVALWEVKERLRKEQSHISPKGPWEKAMVTISRLHGAGGDDVAASLGKLLGWQVFDREVVDYIAMTARVRERIVATFDERKKSEIETWMQTLLDHSALGVDKYFQHLVNVLVAIAEHGQAIIIGRGGNFVVQKNRSCRVLITAPLPLRIERITNKHHILKQDAKKIIEQVDSARVAYIKRYFHQDPNNTALYDLILNSEHLDGEKAARIIKNALETIIGTPFQRSEGQ